MRIAYLGPPGTFSEQAALDYARGADLVPFASITAAALSVLTDEAEEAVCPDDNNVTRFVVLAKEDHREQPARRRHRHAGRPPSQGWPAHPSGARYRRRPRPHGEAGDRPRCRQTRLLAPPGARPVPRLSGAATARCRARRGAQHRGRCRAGPRVRRPRRSDCAKPRGGALRSADARLRHPGRRQQRYAVRRARKGGPPANGQRSDLHSHGLLPRPARPALRGAQGVRGPQP